MKSRHLAPFLRILAVLFVLSLPGSSLPLLGQETRTVTPVSHDLRSRLGLADFYQKQISVDGFPILGSAKVSNFALLEASSIVQRMMTHRPEVLRAMATNRVRLAVMAATEYTTDVPEHASLEPRVYWDRRARGLGATPSAPAVSCAEENLLCFPGDPYATENILVHEFAHAIHETGLNTVDPTFDSRLAQAFHSATNSGLWRGTYASVNKEEYWAEATQSWFDDNRENDALHNHVNTRAELRAYDPAVAQLCQEVFGDLPWRYRKPALRPESDRQHLAGFDAARAPKFRWREESVPDRPRVLIQTAIGDVEVELDAQQAPVTTRNFLHYVHSGFYADGSFFRSVGPDNQPTNSIKIAVIQAQGNPKLTNDFPSAIRLERTRDTHLSHRDGTISMARDGPDTAQDHFFICVGDQPELDFGGRRNPDGQGFAAFGKVVRGMDVVRAIHQRPCDGQLLHEPVRLQRAIRLN
ncbi:MAG: peptidylprolyl isomerase [Verrucomicrobiales bacterium]|nr:peptidylprolyl isomerase [Verrucomicrobiales bacterium]